jgi:hypothetical protein
MEEDARPDQVLKQLKAEMVGVIATVEHNVRISQTDEQRQLNPPACCLSPKCYPIAS